MAQQDYIAEVGIDFKERLYVKPASRSFPMIYRLAVEVNWDNEGKYLYSPVPREWSYLDWYRHILSTIKNEADCELTINGNTNWVNIPDNLKTEIKRIH